MADDDLALETDLGRATIVYEDPNEGTTEREVPNEHVAYFQDHWLVKTDEDEEGRDVVRRIPARRVYYVERTVEEFEDEVRTLRDQVQSFAADLRTKLPVGGGERDARQFGGERGGAGEQEPDDARTAAGGAGAERNDEARPKAGQEGAVNDPRRASDDPGEIDTSEAALADEPGEAIDPEREHAQPVQTEGTEPEVTPEADVPDADIDTNEGGPGSDGGDTGESGR